MTWDVVHPRYARQILQELDDAFRFCETLGLHTLVGSGRFAAHRTRLARLIEVVTPDDQGKIARALPEEAIAYYTDDSTALTERFELCFAIPYLAICDRSLVAEKLALVLGGPRDPAHENAQSNQSRNTLFEIHLAAQAWRGGLPAHLGPVSDVICEFEGKHLFVECKRPLSARKVRRRIREAETQLRRHLRVALPRAEA